MAPSTGEPSVLFLRASGLSQRAGLRRMHAALEREVAPGRHFQCLLTDDAELQRLNREFLKKDYPTDVLSFPAALVPGGMPNSFLGEIAISVDRARDQAAVQGHGIQEEIGILMLHGLLHLMGMDHEKDRGAMRRAESAWRRKLGLPAGLIERSRPKRKVQS